MEFLKSIFGESPISYEDFVKAVNEKGLKLVDLSQGGYISKDKHDTKVSELTGQISGIETQLKEANTTIESFKDMDIEGIQAEREAWKLKAEQAEKDKQKQVYINAVNNIVGKETFTSISAKKAFIADLVAKELPLENDLLLGYADFKKAYQEQDPGAFKADGTPNPIPPICGGTPVKLTKEDFKKLTFAEKLEIKEKQPELYKSLMAK